MKVEQKLPPESGPPGSFKQINLIVGHRQSGKTEKLKSMIVAEAARRQLQLSRPAHLTDPSKINPSLVFLYAMDWLNKLRSELSTVLNPEVLSSGGVLAGFPTNRISDVFFHVNHAVERGKTPPTVYIDDFKISDIPALKTLVLQLPKSITWHVVLE